MSFSDFQAAPKKEDNLYLCIDTKMRYLLAKKRKLEKMIRDDELNVLQTKLEDYNKTLRAHCLRLEQKSREMSACGVEDVKKVLDGFF